MKKLILLTIVLSALNICGFAQTKVTNQNLFDTIGFIPEHYVQKMQEFKKEPVKTGRVMFLGNSITEMGDWKAVLHDSTVVNRGIGGDITFGVLKRLDDILVRKPSKLFLLIGINDIGKDIPDAVIADNIGRIVQKIKAGSPQTQIYLQSILPVNPDVQGFPQHYDKRTHITATNKLIKQTAASLYVPFINLAPLFSDSKGRLDAKYTRDGLHLTAEGGGYKIWVDHLKKMGYL
ncbi:GDSL-type esterase/lipase family protein [Rubrolithibacter danxiaensis]|uniref:GDSL-type esterase/lipase family protein n=1 Tax=Rubrolithibacter danxiaensis TaxID=3390805 RepID=UPI003BF8C7BD